jgi:hypothetical protein
MAVNINIPSQVKTYANLAAFPASGSLKTIYIAEDTNNTYRWDGSTYVEISASAATGLTIGTTPISSGTNGRVLFQGTGNVLQQSSSLFWDGTNSRLGIGTSSPTNILTLGAAVAASLQSSAASIFTSNENASNVFVQVAASNDPVQRPVFAGTKARGTLLSPTAVQSGDAITTFLSTAFDGTAGQASAGLSFDAESNASSGNAPQLISFITGASGGTRTTKMQVRSNGNVLINTTTDAGFRLDVNGTARVSPTLTINGTAGAAPILQLNANGFNSNNQYFVFRASNADKFQFGYTQGGASNRLFIYNPLFANDALRIMEATNNVGINTTTDAGFRLDVNGTARVKTTDTSTPLNVTHAGAVGIQVEANANGYRLRLASSNTNASITTPDSYLSINSGGQLVVIGSTSTYNSAQVAIDSTTKGFLPPRMTTTQKNAIASPATGLQIYDTTLNRPCFYDGTTWITL